MPASLRFVILCLLGYVAASWAVRFDLRGGQQIASLTYPLDTFSMYATPPGPCVSQLLLRDGHNAVHRILAFHAFACTPAASACSVAGAIPYHDDDLTRYMQRHAVAIDSPGSRIPMDVIRRTWTLHPWTSPRLQGDCLVAHCTVAP
jgi:hypothetical protein